MVNYFENCTAGITFEMSSFCAYNCKISQFKHLLCSLVNKILAHVIRNYFSFHFIPIKKKRPNISGIRVVFIPIK